MFNSLVAAASLVLAAGCATARTDVAPPEPPQGAAADTGRSYSRADVRFMQGMIAHHGQALAMTALVPGRAGRTDLPLLAERIEVSQKDEIEKMQRWLRDRGEQVPAPAEHHHHDVGQPLMPGMLTAEEMARLAAATGPMFDRLFLESMIRHHEGALVMVADLFASGGGQESEIYQFASDVDGDQRAEIDRMRRLLNP